MKRVPSESEESRFSTRLLLPLAPGERSPSSQVIRVPLPSSVPPSLAETKVVVVAGVFDENNYSDVFIDSKEDENDLLIEINEEEQKIEFTITMMQHKLSLAWAMIHERALNRRIKT